MAVCSVVVEILQSRSDFIVFVLHKVLVAKQLGDPTGGRWSGGGVCPATPGQEDPVWAFRG